MLLMLWLLLAIHLVMNNLLNWLLLLLAVNPKYVLFFLPCDWGSIVKVTCTCALLPFILPLLQVSSSSAPIYIRNGHKLDEIALSTKLDTVSKFNLNFTNKIVSSLQYIVWLFFHFNFPSKNCLLFNIILFFSSYISITILAKILLF